MSLYLSWLTRTRGLWAAPPAVWQVHVASRQHGSGTTEADSVTLSPPSWSAISPRVPDANCCWVGWLRAAFNDAGTLCNYRANFFRGSSPRFESNERICWLNGGGWEGVENEMQSVCVRLNWYVLADYLPRCQFQNIAWLRCCLPFFFFLAPGVSAKKSSPRAGKKKKKRKSEDHLPMVIGEWESEIEAVADT